MATIASRLAACFPGVRCLAAGDGGTAATRISGALAGRGGAIAGAVASVARLPPIIKTGAGWIGSCEQAARKTAIAITAAAPGRVDLTSRIAPRPLAVVDPARILCPTSTEPERRPKRAGIARPGTRPIANNCSLVCRIDEPARARWRSSIRPRRHAPLHRAEPPLSEAEKWRPVATFSPV